MSIPYYYLPDLVIPGSKIGLINLPIHPFGVLVATGTIIGYNMVVARVTKEGVSREKIESLLMWVLGFGFVGAHVFDMLMYYPQEILTDPTKLFRIWEGISSFGGFMGGTIGFLLWRTRNSEPIMPFVEHVAAVFPISWIFGRAGCSIAHDHPGPLSTSWLAVHFPPGQLNPHFPGDYLCAGKEIYTLYAAQHCAPADWPARLDLGLLEWFCTLPIALVIYLYASKPRPVGRILGLLSMIYAPVRFTLDTLRATDLANHDLRYLGLTPAQWLAILLFGFGLQLFLRAKPNARAVPAPAGGPPTQSEAPAPEAPVASKALAPEAPIASNAQPSEAAPAAEASAPKAPADPDDKA